MRIVKLLPLVMVIVLAACASTPAREAVVTPDVDMDWSPQDFLYRVSAGDELGIRFPINPDLNAQVTVGPDGRGVFPMISGFRVSGMTIEEVDAALTKAYAAHLRRPLVQTQIYNYAAGQIYVGGEVQQPGARVIRGEFTVSQAIVSAGGFKETARTRRVIILRRKAGDGRVLMKTVDVNAALRGAEDGNIRLFPGDVVFVPRSTIAEINRIVQMYVTNTLPFSLNYQLNGAGGQGILP